MDFIVPKFIEREAKIVGPMTFKQFVYIFVAGIIVLVLYFTVAPTNFGLFLIASAFFMGIALALAFLKIEKTTLPLIVKNFFMFLFKPKVYLWRRKEFVPRAVKLNEDRIKEDDESALRITSKSKLGKIFTNLWTNK